MDDGIKRKLVGAAALVIAGVLVLPLISPQSENARHLKQSVPEMPEAPDMSMTPPQAINIDVSDLIQPEEVAAKPAQVEVAAIKIDETVIPASQFDLPETPEAGQALTWQIQVASFAKSENATALRDKLRAEGHQAYEQLARDGIHTRVFIGPTTQKSELEQVLPKIAKQYKLSPQIIPFQPK